MHILVTNDDGVLAPGLLAYALLLMPFIFVLTFIIPLAIMHWVERLPKPIVYRYIFG